MALMMYTVNHGQNSIPLGKAAFYGCTRRSFIIISALLLLVLVTPLAFGQSAGEADLLTRSALTGDWGGARSWLADNGVSLDLRYTSFYQGLAQAQTAGELRGGSPTEARRYHGRHPVF
jgi:carbohydrate-selective porin OprB